MDASLILGQIPHCMEQNSSQMPGVAWGGDGQFLELIGTSHRSCYILIYDIISSFTPEPPVQIHFPSTRCDVNSFNG